MGQHVCVLDQGRPAIPVARPSHWPRQQDLGTVLANPRSCCQLPRPLSARPALPCPALPSPPGWLRAWSRWDLSALPSFVCLSFLPSQPLSVLCFIMPWGEPGPARLPAVHPWEAAREQACLRGPQLCGHPFPCLATPVAPAWPFPSPTVHCQPPS